jgi:peptidoglycan hydrolase-like protein with peptidoglycan-binding domain
MPSTHCSAQIRLALSAAADIVAVAGGQKYSWAQTALEQAGFHGRADGTYGQVTA